MCVYAGKPKLGDILTDKNTLHKVDFLFYFILSSEINAYQKQLKVISVTSEMIDISLYFNCSVFWTTSDYSIHLLLNLTSELQTPITFLYVNGNIKCGYAFSS